LQLFTPFASTPMDESASDKAGMKRVQFLLLAHAYGRFRQRSRRLPAMGVRF